MAAPQSDTAVLKEYFGMSLPEAKQELTTQGGLTKEDKAELASGIRNGSLTYDRGPLHLLPRAPEPPEPEAA